MLKRLQQLLVKYQILLPILIFLLLITPYLGTLPYLDSNIDFLQIYDLYAGGFPQVFQNWQSIHPPLKIILFHFIFYFPQSTLLFYTLLGTVMGVTGLISIYFLTNKLVDRKTAFLAAFLLGSCPIYIATGLFGLTDFLVAVLILISLLFYSYEKYKLYSVTATLLVLTKETGLLLPIIILFVEIINQIYKKLKFPKTQLIFLTIPILVALGWFVFLRLSGQSEWQDWIFAETSSRGAIYTIVYNLFTLNIFNKFAFAQWQQFFFLNYNWVFWALTFFGFSFYISANNWQKIIFKFDQKSKTVLIMIIFCLTYFLTILSFQTYTIPRYALPLYVLGAILTSFAIKQITQKIPFITISLYAFIIFISFQRLFFSTDPLSHIFWGQTTIFNNQVIYNLPQSLAGNDGMTYNLQFLEIAKTRSDYILTSQSGIHPNDFWLFPDIKNDQKTFNILKNQGHNFTIPQRASN